MRGDEAFAGHIERARGALGIVVEALEGDRAHQRHRVQLHRGEVEHRADDQRDVHAVVTDLVDGRAQRVVPARARRAHRVGRAFDLEGLGDGSRVVGVEAGQREHPVHPVGLLGVLQPVLVLVVEVDVVPGDDRGHPARVDLGLVEPRVEVAIDGHEHRELGRPRRLGDELAQAPKHLRLELAFEVGEAGGDVVLGEIAPDLRVATRDVQRLPVAQRGATGQQALEERVERVSEGCVDRHPRDRDSAARVFIPVRQSTPP